MDDKSIVDKIINNLNTGAIDWYSISTGKIYISTREEDIYDISFKIIDKHTWRIKIFHGFINCVSERYNQNITDITMIQKLITALEDKFGILLDEL